MASESKIKKDKPLHGQSREIVFNVHKYFLNEAEQFKCNSDSQYFQRIQERVSEATGVSRRTINQILNKDDDIKATPSTSLTFVTPKKGKMTKEHLLNLDSFDYDVIRRMVKKEEQETIEEKHNPIIKRGQKVPTEAKEMLFKIHSFYKTRKHTDQNSYEYMNDINLNDYVAKISGISARTVQRIIQQGNDSMITRGQVIFDDETPQVGKMKKNRRKTVLLTPLVKHLVYRVYTHHRYRKFNDTTSEEFKNDMNLRKLISNITGVGQTRLGELLREAYNSLHSTGKVEFANKSDGHDGEDYESFSEDDKNEEKHEPLTVEVEIKQEVEDLPADYVEILNPDNCLGEQEPEAKKIKLEIGDEYSYDQNSIESVIINQEKDDTRNHQTRKDNLKHTFSSFVENIPENELDELEQELQKLMKKFGC